MLMKSLFPIRAKATVEAMIKNMMTKYLYFLFMIKRSDHNLTQAIHVFSIIALFRCE